MDNTTNNVAGEVTSEEAVELIELGDVSEETKGGWWGASLDGGSGWRIL